MASRAHVVLPEDLIEEVDKVAGKRKRSRFIEEAIMEKLARERLTKALIEARGILDLEDYPAWQTPEEVSVWVARSRGLDDETRGEKIRGREA